MSVKHPARTALGNPSWRTAAAASSPPKFLPPLPERHHHGLRLAGAPAVVFGILRPANHDI